jgi:hypothetical protein
MLVSKKYLLSSNIISILLLSILWYFFWPGKFTPDSLDQLKQAMGIEPLSNNHPLLMSLIMKASIVEGLFLYPLFQILIISICTGLTCSLILKFYRGTHWSNYLFIIIFNLCVCFLPPAGLYNIIIWKDIPHNYLSMVQVTSLICLCWSINKKNINIDGKLLIMCCVFGGLAMNFRHNAFTIAIPSIIVSLGLFYSKYKHCNIKILLKYIFYGILLFTVILGIRWGVKTILLPNQILRNYYDNFDVRSFVIRNDFLQALKLGMPITKNEYYELNKYIDVEKSVIKTNLNNAFYQWYPVFRIDRKSSESEFINIAEKVLVGNILFWLKTKYIYSLKLIDSVEGYQIPLFYYDKYNYKDYNVNINMDEHLQNNRLNYVKLLYTKYSIIPHKVFWSLWPQLYFVLIIAIYSIIKSFLNYLYIKNNNVYYVIFLLLPFFFFCCLAVPLFLVSTSNDFRYFWPVINYNYVMVFILIQIIYKHLSISR